MLIRLLFILLIFTSVSIGAEETYLKLSNSADEIAKAMVLKDQPFNLSTQQADTIKNVAINEKIISELTPACRENCDLKEKTKSPFELRTVLTWNAREGRSYFYNTSSYNNYKVLKSTEAIYTKLGLPYFTSLSDKDKLVLTQVYLNNYSNFTSTYPFGTKPTLAQTLIYESKLKAAFQNTRMLLSIGKIPPEAFPGYGGILGIDPDYFNEQVKINKVGLLFYNLVNKYPNDKRKQMDLLQAASKEMSFEEKLQLVKLAGGVMSENYDHDRVKRNNSASNGSISLSQILEAERTGGKKGVCRDIAVAQTQMMKGLRVKNCYVVAFTTQISSHATMACSDPADRKKIHKLNYDEYSVSENVEGTESLTTLGAQGSHYRIYDNEGRSLATLPTEFLEVIRDQSNLDRSDYNPMSNNQSRVQSVLINYKKDGALKDTQLSLFHGTLSSGDELIGTVASIQTADRRKYASTHSTVALGLTHVSQNSDLNIISFDGKSVTTLPNENAHTNNYLTLNMKSQIESTPLDLPLQTVVKVGTKVIADGTMYKSDGKEVNFDGNTIIKTDIELEKKYPQGAAHLSGEASFEPYINSVSNPEFNGLYSPLQVIKADANYNLRDYELLSEGTMAMRGALGTTVDTKATVRNSKKKQAMSIGYQGPLTADVPYFISGAEKKIYVEGVQQEFLNHFDVKIFYEHPLEKGIDPRVNLKLEGHL